jgi:hypothetical protein
MLSRILIVVVAISQAAVAGKTALAFQGGGIHQTILKSSFLRSECVCLSPENRKKSARKEILSRYRIAVQRLQASSFSSSNEQELNEKFKEWVQINGIQHQSLQISQFDGLRGLAANDDLFPGQVTTFNL